MHWTSTDVEKKLQELEQLEGRDRLEMAEEATFDGRCMGICMNPDCDNSFEIEPDQSRGWCDMCSQTSVASVLILMGMI